MLQTLGLFANVAALVAGQFNNVTIPGPSGGTVKVGQPLQSIVSTHPSFNDYDDHPGTMELLWGPTGSGSPDSTVVDVMSTNIKGTLFIFLYTLPKSIPPGQYHMRASAAGESGIGLSDTFEITAPDTSFCNGQPPTFQNITSPTDPNFRSFRFTYPQAYDYIFIPMANETGGFTTSQQPVSWQYLDARNSNNTGISNLLLEFISEDTGQVTGHFPIDFTDPTSIAKVFPANNTILTPGFWKLRATYTNQYENSGAPTTSMSEVFNVNGNCSSSVPGSNKTGDSSRGYHIIFVWLPVVFFSSLVTLYLT